MSGLLRRVLTPPGEARAVTELPWWPTDELGQPIRATKSGVTVTPKIAMGVAAAWSCATLLADTISMLPVHTYRDTGDVHERVTNPRVVARPSDAFTRREWLFQAVVSAALAGNAYGLVTSRNTSRDAALLGRPETVEWVDSASVNVDDNDFARPDYRVNGKPVERANIVHLRRYPRGGSAVGHMPLELHRELFGVAVAARDYASSWFGSGGHPTALLVNDNPLTEEQAKTARKRWRAGATRGVRVLGSGWKYLPVQEGPGNSGLSDQVRDVGLQVCQVFRVPPEMIGLASTGSSVTYANREQRSIDYLTFAVEPWLRMFEDWWSDETVGDDRFVKFNTGSLLRVDLLTRYRSHETALRSGFASVNERRRLEDLPPIPGGDKYLWPPYRGFPLEREDDA